MPTNLERIVYCDLDGVLFDFLGGIASHVPDCLSVSEYNSRYTNEPEFAGQVNKVRDNISFWEGLQPYLGAQQFVKEMSEMLGGRGWELKFLSAAGTGADFHAAKCGKELSLYGILADGDKLITVQGSSDKKKYATAGTILIDDFRRSLDEWREGGGEAIHHSSPTGDSFYDTLESLSELIDEIESEAARKSRSEAHPCLSIRSGAGKNKVVQIGSHGAKVVLSPSEAAAAVLQLES